VLGSTAYAVRKDIFCWLKGFGRFKGGAIFAKTIVKSENRNGV
jgi:hypothetical protein